MLKCKEIIELRIGSRKEKSKDDKGSEHIVHSLIIKVIDDNSNEKVTGVDVGINTLITMAVCIDKFLKDKKDIYTKPQTKDASIDFFSLSYLLLPIAGPDAECAMMSIGKSEVYGRITINNLIKFYDNVKGLIPNNADILTAEQNQKKKDTKMVQFDKSRGMSKGGRINR